MIFAEKFQTAFDPPHFFKVMLQIIFSENVQKNPYVKVQNLQHKSNFWINLDPPLLKVFREIIRFGTLSLTPP